MRTECLPIDAIPHASRLFRDFLATTEGIHSFYPHPPFSRNFIPIDYPPERRKAISDILARQNRGWGASAQTLSNIERLRSGTNAIVTGQQVVIFGGQMMALLKALTAIKIAAETQTVPIFWLATEDHDLAEVSAVRFLGTDRSLHKLELQGLENEGAPVGSITLKGIDELVAQTAELSGDGEIVKLLRDTYTAASTFGTAAARIFTRLFADFGLVLIDSSDPAIHRLGAPLLAAAAEKSESLNSALRTRDLQLQEAGYHTQVNVTANSTLLFTTASGPRTAVKRTNGLYTFGEEKPNVAALKERVLRHPEVVSPNALLRPVFQDYLLPTLAYVGGPAEIAYFAQSEVLYRELLGRVTPILPRVSATIVEPKIANRLQQYGMSVPDVFVPATDLTRRLAEKRIPQDLKQSMRATEADLSQRLVELASKLREMDPTLQAAATTALSKVRYQFAKLNHKAASASMRRQNEIAQHSAQLSNTLFPNDNLQEREIAGVNFLARHGLGLLRHIYDIMQTGCPGHQVLYLDQ